MYQFDSLGEPARDEGFGAIVEAAEPVGAGHEVQLRFLSEVARIYALPDVALNFWHGGVAGTGATIRVFG